MDRDRHRRDEGGDTVEYDSGAVPPWRRNDSSRQGRGYWIDVDKARVRRALREGGAEGGGGPSGRSSDRERSSAPRRRLFAVVISACVLAVLGVLAALVLTGHLVVPLVSERVFPIHYQEEIAQMADKYGEDPYLVAAMVNAESGFDPEAESGAGAVGLMQLMETTAEHVAADILKWDDSVSPDRTDPLTSLELGVAYLAYLMDRYEGETRLALAAYNGGLSNVDGWIEEAGGAEYFRLSDIKFPETREYVERVEYYHDLYVRLHPDIFS